MATDDAQVEQLTQQLREAQAHMAETELLVGALRQRTAALALEVGRRDAEIASLAALLERPTDPEES